MHVKNQPYKKHIHAPKPGDLYKMHPVDVKILKSMQIAEGSTVTQDISMFVGYVHCINTIEDVKKEYLKVRHLHGTAHHIVCAYRFGAYKPILEQDAMDDREHRAGCNILQYMKEKSITGLAIYVFRYFGGTHLGPKRFDIVAESTVLAMESVKELN